MTETNTTKKRLFAIAVEKGARRIPDVLYTHAESREEILAGLVTVKKSLPKYSRVVGVAQALGYYYDDKGRVYV